MNIFLCSLVCSGLSKACSKKKKKRKPQGKRQTKEEWGTKAKKRKKKGGGMDPNGKKYFDLTLSVSVTSQA